MKPRRWSLAWRHLVVGLWLAACGGALSTHDAGGESHFLRHCEEACAGALECISGVCTRGCLVGEDECSDLSPKAVCTDASIEPGAIAVCDVSCEADQDCAALGADFGCETGFCRDSSLPGQPMRPPGGAGSGSAGSNNAGAGGQTSGGPSCSLTTNQPCGTSEVCVDQPDDDCDGNVDASCAGSCREAYRTPACAGLGGGTPCPAGFVCRSDPRTALGTDPTSLCAEEYLPEMCSLVANGECGDGFECVDLGSRGICAADRVNCSAPWTCDIADPPSCPYGYARSRVGVVDGLADCSGPCVPITRCGCESDAECPQAAACDRVSGDCVALLPWQPPGECALPFDAGPCDAAQRVFAAVDGVCTEQVYGGCEGNANRFIFIEECVAVCEGRPTARPCPEGRVGQRICLACGPVGGCDRFYEVCAQPCETPEDCDRFNCSEGFCQVTGCD